MPKILLKEFTLFFVGFLGYITIELTFRGYTYWQMGMCGGIVTLILDKINDRISWDLDILIQGFLGSFLITSMELVVGFLTLINGKESMWDYSNLPLNYKGIICVPFSLLWILLSIVAIFIADAINYYIFDEEPAPYYRLFGKVIIRFPIRR